MPFDTPEERREWAELHGYVYYECRECGWKGHSDGGGPDCNCAVIEDDDEDEEEG
jgi:hypothetical protein